MPLHHSLTREIVERISEDKREPDWMRKKRLRAYDFFVQAEVPTWAPSLKGLDLEKLSYYIPPTTDEHGSWQDVPEEIVQVFDALGIPEAERTLGGVGAHFDSTGVYHRLKEYLREMGVVFETMETALETHSDLVERYFMRDCVSIADHVFAMLHAAVWSGGSFIYVPKGVRVTEPLQAYFRMNTKASGQFEHTIIIADEGSSLTYIEGCSAPRYNASSLHAGCVEVFVHERAEVRYISIENWSRNTYNLNTKRALVYKDATMRWVGGNMGSCVTMLYPTSFLLGEGARSDNLGVVVAGEGQVQDVGARAIHCAPHTKSTIRSKSISKDGGVANYRGSIRVLQKAHHTESSLVCDALLLDETSKANAFPAVRTENDKVTISHEASIGSIGEEELFFLASRGLSRDEAVRLAVQGFTAPIVEELPLEYAVEFNKLIALETEQKKKV
jgi:Fe-S cluster assembly protein SufB